jgi:Na+/H+ antiporter NhaD/arsenite permease-like protein
MMFYIYFLAFLLAIAYSSTIGGFSTLVGTSPNIFVQGFAHT